MFEASEVGNMVVLHLRTHNSVCVVTLTIGGRGHATELTMNSEQQQPGQ